MTARSQAMSIVDLRAHADVLFLNVESAPETQLDSNSITSETSDGTGSRLLRHIDEVAFGGRTQKVINLTVNFDRKHFLKH